MVDEYVAWYDRHRDPAWQDILLAPPGENEDRENGDRENGDRQPWALALPRSGDDLAGMGRSFAKTLFLSAGNVTHDPAYGNLIALGILTTLQGREVATEHVANAATYRDMIANTGRFLTYCSGGAIIGQRLRPDPRDRVALKVVRETDAGVFISGRLGMHTSPAFAEDLYIGGLSRIEIGGDCVGFIVPVNAPGVTILCRRVAARDDNPFLSPLSGRFDELDGQMWLEEVFVPWERVFPVGPDPDPIARWLRWHHLYGWLARAEFSLGLALALTDAMGLTAHEPTVEYLVDMVVDVQTVRTCLLAGERDPEFTPAGYCHPNHRHIGAGGIALFKARQRISEVLRVLPGSSLVVAPSDSDLALPELAAGLEEALGGGGYSAKQRAALLQLTWDHVASALDGRESAFELHASGGPPNWRAWLRQNFNDYNELANAVLDAIEMPMPRIDVGMIPAAPIAPRRPVTVPTAAEKK
jgi:4-hydroxyphenylacetate 3-monooxygenase